MIKKISFISEERTVEGTLFIPDNGKKNPGVIFLHGSGSSEKNYLPMAEDLYQRDIAALTINFRGHSTPETLDKMTAFDGVSDGLAAYDFFIKQNGVDPERMGLSGGSFGALIAVYVLSKRKVKSVLLRAPALYKDEMMKESMGKILADENRIFNDMQNIKDTEAMKIVSKFKGSLIVVQSEKDALIPASVSRAFYEEAREAHKRDIKMIKNAPHSIKDPAQRQVLVDIITAWFSETL